MDPFAALGALAPRVKKPKVHALVLEVLLDYARRAHPSAHALVHSGYPPGSPPSWVTLLGARLCKKCNAILELIRTPQLKHGFELGVRPQLLDCRSHVGAKLVHVLFLACHRFDGFQ